MAPSHCIQSTRRRQSGQARPSRARTLGRLVGELIQAHLDGGRSFCGLVVAVDPRSGFMEISQLADDAPAYLAFVLVDAAPTP